MDSYSNKQTALAAKESDQLFAVFWSRAETNGAESFFAFKTPEDVMGLFKRSIERGVTNHFHEVVQAISKIYFDLDLKIPDCLINNEEVKRFCQQQLCDNGENYAGQYVNHFQSSLEQFLVYAVQDAVTQHYADIFSGELYNRGFVFDRPLSQLPPVDRLVYMKDLDYLFDTYRNSRPHGEGVFKISWHLVFCANEFIMDRREQKTVAARIIKTLQQSLTGLAELLNRL